MFKFRGSSPLGRSCQKKMSQEIVSECLNRPNRHSCAEPRHQFGDSGGEIMSHGHSYRRCRWFSPFLFFAFDAATATRAGWLGWGFYLRYRWGLPKQASITETSSTPARKKEFLHSSLYLPCLINLNQDLPFLSGLFLNVLLPIVRCPEAYEWNLHWTTTSGMPN